MALCVSLWHTNMLWYVIYYFAESVGKHSTTCITSSFPAWWCQRWRWVGFQRNCFKNCENIHPGIHFLVFLKCLCILKRYIFLKVLLFFSQIYFRLVLFHWLLSSGACILHCICFYRCLYSACLRTRVKRLLWASRWVFKYNGITSPLPCNCQSHLPS